MNTDFLSADKLGTTPRHSQKLAGLQAIDESTYEDPTGRTCLSKGGAGRIVKVLSSKMSRGTAPMS